MLTQCGHPRARAYERAIHADNNIPFREPKLFWHGSCEFVPVHDFCPVKPARLYVDATQKSSLTGVELEAIAREGVASEGVSYEPKLEPFPRWRSAREPLHWRGYPIGVAIQARKYGALGDCRPAFAEGIDELGLLADQRVDPRRLLVQEVRDRLLLLDWRHWHGDGEELAAGNFHESCSASLRIQFVAGGDERVRGIARIGRWVRGDGAATLVKGALHDGSTDVSDRRTDRDHDAARWDGCRSGHGACTTDRALCGRYLLTVG